MYCDDHLTTTNKTILLQAKKLKSEGKLTFVWIKNCQVRVGITENSEVIVLRSEHQLDELKSRLDQINTANETLGAMETEEIRNAKERNAHQRSLEADANNNNSRTNNNSVDFRQTKRIQSNASRQESNRNYGRDVRSFFSRIANQGHNKRDAT